MLGTARKFLKDLNGNVAITFAVAALPMLLAGGAATDYVRAINAQAVVQAAVDSAALGAGASSSTSMTEVRRLANTYLEQNGRSDLIGAIDNVRVQRGANNTLQVSASASINATIMKLAGYDRLDVSAVTEVIRGSGELELALALDTTGSMRGAKLAALQSAASDMVDDLIDPSDPNNRIKMSIVPFAQYVNVGMQNRGAPWMDVPDDRSTAACWETYPDATKSNCRMVSVPSDDDGQQASTEIEQCDWDLGTPVEECGTRNSVWTGCAGSRPGPFDTRDGFPTEKHPGLLDTKCPSPITPLTNSKTTLKSAISGMRADGWTYIPAGLLWGWYTLSSREPFEEASTYSAARLRGIRKTLVLMTDGANTVSPIYPSHDGRDVAASNENVDTLCTNVKAMGITVYTVSFQVSDATAEAMLKRCASGADHYFNTESVAELKIAFADIAKKLGQLRIVK